MYSIHDYLGLMQKSESEATEQDSVLSSVQVFNFSSV